MNRLRERFAEGRTYFEPQPPPIAPSGTRQRERWAITELQVAAATMGRSGQTEAAAQMYDEAAARWEKLTGYGDFASSARYEARRLRKAAP